MGDLLRTLISVVEYLWPFETVYTYQRGCIYVWGRYWKTVGPGIYPILPYFMTLMQATITPDPYETNEQTIETKDGGTLTFTAAMRLIVKDPAAAFNNVTGYRESAIEDAAAVLAERLAVAPATALAAAKRTKLVDQCESEINEVLSTYGCEIEGLRFTNFIRDIPVYRIIGNPFGATSE